MNTAERHSFWEVFVDGRVRPILACKLFDEFRSCTQDNMVAQSILKAKIGQNASYVRCGHCDCALHYRAKSATTQAHFAHSIKRAVNLEKTLTCPFYTGFSAFTHGGDIYKGEGQWHLKTKHWLADFLSHSPLYRDVTVEKYLFSQDDNDNRRRKPDITFYDNHGQRFAVELTRWWMSPEIVQARELFFREQEINLLWLFSPDCESQNSTTLNLIMYGSPASLSKDSSLLLSTMECNAFTWTDAAKAHTLSSGVLSFEVIYPKPKLTNDELNINVGSAIRTLDDLKLEPHKRLPYAIVTSESFKHAIELQNKAQADTERRNWQSKRQEFSSLLRKLREMAYDPVVIHFHSDKGRLIEELNELVDYLPDHHLHPAVTRYHNKAQDNIIAAQSKFENDKKDQRKNNNLAQKRAQIQNCFEIACNSDDADYIQRQLSNLVIVSSELNVEEMTQLEAEIQKVRSGLQARQDTLKRPVLERVANESSAHQAQYKQLTDFISELKAGYSHLVVDEGLEEVKAKRLANWASRHGYHSEYHQVTKLLPHALKDVRTKYLNNTFPLLSKGWRKDMQFKDELTVALELLGQKKLSRRDRSANMLLNTKQRLTHHGVFQVS
ncbi:hypothetical protein AB4450_18580, partial [Vibrio breoganii]